jgi:hypothetical protein
MGKGPKVGEEQQEDVFQAVLLADNFCGSIFGPTWAEKRYPSNNPFDSDNDEDDFKDDDDYDEVDGGRGDEQKVDILEVQPTIEYRLSQEVILNIIFV